MSTQYLQPNLKEYNSLEELNTFSLRWSKTAKKKFKRHYRQSVQIVYCW
jgi:hypothetical protein